MMEQELGDRTRPLFGRVHRYHLEPMKIGDCRKFHPDMSDVDQMRMYLTFGGIPMYYDSPETKTYGEYVENYVLRRNSALYLEGESMICREFPNSEEYNAILDAMADDCDTIADMVINTGLDRSTVNHHLDRLMGLDLVGEVHPMAGSKVKPARFRIKDRMLAFHHLVVRRNESLLSSQGHRFEIVMDHISTFLGKMFELQCMDYMKEHYVVMEIGSWIGRTKSVDDDGNVTTEESDIDIVAYVREGRSTVEIFCECKFTGDRMGMSDVKKLRSRMDGANVGRNNRLMLFSRSGFDEGLRKYAGENDIVLVDLKAITS